MFLYVIHLSDDPYAAAHAAACRCLCMHIQHVALVIQYHHPQPCLGWRGRDGASRGLRMRRHWLSEPVRGMVRGWRMNRR